MSNKALAWMAAIASLIALISIFMVDRTLALGVHDSGFENSPVFIEGTRVLDEISGRLLLHDHRNLSGVLLGGLFVLIGALWLIVQRTNLIARALVFSGGVQLATIGIAWEIKNLFSRLRPFQVIENNNWDHVWFAGGDSFPSGHNAFFWGLFLPLAYLFPRYALALLAIPVFIAIARIDANYHFLSDVTSAMALAALVTLAAGFLCRRWVGPTESTSNAR